MGDGGRERTNVRARSQILPMRPSSRQLWSGLALEGSALARELCLLLAGCHPGSKAELFGEHPSLISDALDSPNGS